MDEIRKRPMKTYRVLRAHGPYQKGHVFQPTGLYRDQLLRMGIIEEVRDPARPAAPPAPAQQPAERMTQASFDRMVRVEPGEPGDAAGARVNRRRGG